MPAEVRPMPVSPGKAAYEARKASKKMAQDKFERREALSDQGDAVAKLVMDCVTAFFEGRASITVNTFEVAGTKTTTIGFQKKP